MPPLDFNTAITLTLAALAVLLTALAIMVAVAAWWGFTSIKDEAKKIASQVATEAAEKKLIEFFETEALKDRIKRMMDATKPIEPLPGSIGTPYTEKEDSDHGSADSVRT